MIDAAQRMKTILGQMTATISAQDYLGAVKFLDELAAEARGRIEKSSALPSRLQGDGVLAAGGLPASRQTKPALGNLLPAAL